MKKPKFSGSFQDRRGEGVTQYQPWFHAQMKNPESVRRDWVKEIISLIDEQGKNNPSKRELAKYLKNREACHVIGFAPYIEYVKHQAEGSMELEGAYLHAFGNPCLLVYDKKSKSLLIVGPAIDFDVNMGIRG